MRNSSIVKGTAGARQTDRRASGAEQYAPTAERVHRFTTIATSALTVGVI